VHRAAALEFGHPDVAEWDMPLPAPFADRSEASRDMPGSPVVYAPICEGDEPNVFSEALGDSEGMKMSTGPNLGSEPCYSPLLDKIWIKTDFQKVIGTTCFKWDKPSGLRPLGGRWRSSPGSRGRCFCVELRRRQPHISPM
jgi:hypothetical protein